MTLRTFKSLLLLLLMAWGSGNALALEPVSELLKALKKEIAPDSRTAIWDITAESQNDQWLLKGKVDNQSQKDAIIQLMNDKHIRFTDSIQVLEFTQKKPWGIVKLSIASLRTAGKHPAEMATQAIMGTPVKILEYAGDWARVQTPDNYISYCPGNSLHKVTQAELDDWKKSERYIVTVYQTQLVDKPRKGMTVSDLVLGNILEYKGRSGKYIQLATPDGRIGYVHKSEVKELSSWAQQNFDAKQIRETAFRMMGSGYLWGGTSTKLTDCSGLVKVCYFSNAIILQRDASQQALTGKIIKAGDWKTAEEGDLVFFGTKSGRVTHVGIYLEDGEYIHCSGQVKLNSVDPEAKGYLTTPFLSISRINSEIGTKGIIYVRDHQWYF